jgi:hypothetical protein
MLGATLGHNTPIMRIRNCNTVDFEGYNIICITAELINTICVAGVGRPARHEGGKRIPGNERRARKPWTCR